MVSILSSVCVIVRWSWVRTYGREYSVEEFTDSSSTVILVSFVFVFLRVLRRTSSAYEVYMRLLKLIKSCN